MQVTPSKARHVICAHDLLSFASFIGPICNRLLSLIASVFAHIRSHPADVEHLSQGTLCKVRRLSLLTPIALLHDQTFHAYTASQLRILVTNFLPGKYRYLSVNDVDLDPIYQTNECPAPFVKAVRLLNEMGVNDSAQNRINANSSTCGTRISECWEGTLLHEKDVSMPELASRGVWMQVTTWPFLWDQFPKRSYQKMLLQAAPCLGPSPWGSSHLVLAAGTIQMPLA